MRNVKHLLSTVIDLPIYDIRDFWTISPYSPVELANPNRITEVRIWRQVGMSWMALSGVGVSKAGEMFQRDHTTVLHAMKIVYNALTESGYEDIREIISKLKEQGSRTLASANDNPILSAHSLESKLNELQPWIFDPSQFYCSSQRISLKMGGDAKRCINQCSGCR